MKQVKSILKEKFNPVLSTADTVNHESAPAWTKPSKEMLEQFAMTGVLQQSFYATAEMHTEDALNILKANSANDIAEAIVKGRNEGFVRTFPILGLVYLSTVDTELFKQAFPKVILTGGDLGDFIDICKSMRGFGRSIKTAISDWLDKKMDAYYAQKYRTQLADAIRLVRYKGDRNSLTPYVLHTYGAAVKGWTPEKYSKLLENTPVLNAHEWFLIHCMDGKLDKALAILKEHDLDVDSLTSVYDKFNAEIWAEIARKTPVMRFLKYLNKFTAQNVFANKIGMDIAKSKLTVENLQKAKVFPFRLYTAYCEVGDTALRDLLAKVMNDYAEKTDWGVFNRYSWAICPDVSGSMTWSLGKAKLRASDIAGMFSGFFNKGLDDCIVLPWDTRVHGFQANRYDSVMTQIRTISNARGGGTDMSCALQFMISNRIRKDCVVYITDTEEYGNPWIEAWQRYRHVINDKAKAFIIRCDSYATNPFPNDIAEKWGIHPIYGFNDNVIKYMEYIISK